MGRGMDCTWTDGPLMHGAIAASVVVLPYCDKPDGAHSSTAVGAM